jgi:Zn-dependent protease with chaperone function
MNSYLQFAFAASAITLISGSLSGKAGNPATPSQTLSIHLYNDAEVNPRTLHWATAEVDRLFRKANIQVIWQRVSDETTQPGEMDKGSTSCRGFDEPGYIVIRLIPNAPLTTSPGALGLARPFTREGSQILIFWDRLQTLMRSMNVQDYTILGHVMAHEIGHVLLHSVEHSAGGIMQTRWNGMSWRLASAGLLVFSREESKRMKIGLAIVQGWVDGTKIASNETR